jgi:hypothetical protein
MRALIFSAVMTVATAATAQVKGLEKATIGTSYADAYDSQSMYGVVANGDTTYVMSVRSENVGQLTSSHVEMMLKELTRVIEANGRPIDSPDRVTVSDRATHPTLKEISLKVRLGSMSEERFDYVIGTHVVSLIYTAEKCLILIYKNPFAGEY